MKAAESDAELLGPTDMGVVRFRRLMLEQARALQRGVEPAVIDMPESFRVRAGGIVLDEVLLSNCAQPDFSAGWACCAELQSLVRIVPILQQPDYWALPIFIVCELTPLPDALPVWVMFLATTVEWAP